MITCKICWAGAITKGKNRDLLKPHPYEINILNVSQKIMASSNANAGKYRRDMSEFVVNVTGVDRAPTNI